MRLIDADALIKEACAEGAYGYVDAEQIADAPTVDALAVAQYLIANGVTVQEWISVKDRLPENSDYYLVLHQDKYNGSASIALDKYVKCGAGEWWANEFTHNITHWMPIPGPPKGE